MDFSLDWFTSIPGLLITAGVLLLLIALIILIATRKKKKDIPAENADATTAQPAPTANPQAEAVAAPTATPTGAVPEMNSPALSAGTIMDIPAPVEATQPQPMDPNVANTMAMPVMDTTTSAPAVTMVDPMAQPSVQEMPTEVTPVAPEPVAPAVEPAPAMPTVDPMAAPEMAPVAPTVAPEPVAPAVEPTPAMPTVNPMATPEVTPIAPTVAPEPVVPAVAPESVAPSIEPVAPVTEQTAQQGPVIYGGANPIVPEINIQEPQHQIYGGANPLENTQSIPISNLVGPNQQTVVQTPTAEPTIVAQQPAPEQPINPGQ